MKRSLYIADRNAITNLDRPPAGQHMTILNLVLFFLHKWHEEWCLIYWFLFFTFYKHPSVIYSSVRHIFFLPTFTWCQSRLLWNTIKGISNCKHKQGNAISEQTCNTWDCRVIKGKRALLYTTPVSFTMRWNQFNMTSQHMDETLPMKYLTDYN